MADEGRQISQGTNRGEAVFLGDSTFDPVANARRVGETMRMEREKRDIQQKEDLSLLSDNVKTKWETDTFNYFEPRIGQLKSTIVDAFRKQDGKLTPIQRMEFKNAWDGIRNEAEVSNATFKSYSDQVKLLDQNPDKFDLEESRANLNILRDPLSNPETKREVEQMYGGNILKWRADNADKYTVVPAYSREGFVQDLMKGKGLEAQAVYDKAADGKPISYKTETGTYEYRGKKGVTDNQLKSKVEAIWGDTDRKSQRTREQDLETVKSKFIIDENGRPVLVDETDALSQEVLKNANLKGKTTPNEIYKELGKAFTFTDLRQRFPQSDIRQPIANRPTGRTSGGKGFTDNYTVAVTEYSKQRQVPDQATSVGPKVKRVAISPKKSGADSESLQMVLQGRPVRPIAFIVDDETGDVSMQYATRMEAGKNQLTGAPIYKDLTETTRVDQEIEADIAAKYGFSNYNDFKRDALGYKPKSQQSAQPSKPNTGGGKTQSTKVYTKSDWAKLPISERRNLLKQGVKVQ